MIDASKAQAIAERCITEARAFWGIDPMWQIDLELASRSDGVPAEISHMYDYLRATIELDPGQCQDGADVWQYTAHEVAHLLTSPFDIVAMGQDEDAIRRWMHAVERTTTHLERVFLRERPYDGEH